ncbi:MAG: hypothetical protein ABSG64_12455 [Solirubrobacteraceae bacterium]
MSGSFRITIAWGLVVIVTWVTDRRDVTDYSVVLAFEEGAQTHTIRVYDGAHGVNELHRYTRSAGKAPAEVFHRGTLGEGMRVALAEVDANHEAILDSWSRS